MRWIGFCLMLFMVVGLAHASGSGPSSEMLWDTTRSLGAAISTEEVAAAQLKSPGQAFLMSLVVPGSGQLYVGKKRGLAQLAAEVGLIAGYFIVHRDAEGIQDDYVAAVREGVVFDENDPTYATYMASLPSPSDPFSSWNMEDFEHATQTNNWHYVYTEENGQPIKRVGPFYWKDLPEAFRAATREELKKAEIDSALRQKAYDIRMRANDRFRLATTLLGVTIANHLVAAIDARIAAKRHNARSQAPTLTLSTQVKDDQIESRLAMNLRW